MSDRVTCTIVDGVADVRMNRPEKMNALDASMFDALVETGESLKEATGLRAVVLSGEGRAFCAGLDFSGFQAMAETSGLGGMGRVGDTNERITHRGQQACWVWQELSVPVIAAVHGHALGGGCQIALGADLRFVAPDAKLSVLEIRWGLIPDMTGTYLLTRLIGLEAAKDLTFSGRMVSGEEALAMGLASRVCADPRAEALAYAAELAAKNPEAVRRAKALLNASLAASPAEQFAAERSNIAALIGSPNQVEAVTAFFEKRPPRFADS